MRDKHGNGNMLSKFNGLNGIFYIWRLVMTGLSFILFGMGGLVVSFLAYPVLLLLTNKSTRYIYGQLIIHYSFKSFVIWMRMMGVFSMEIHHQDRLNRSGGLLIVANHPTLIDVVIILSMVRQCDCVVKAGLLESVFTKRPLWAAGYIGNDDGELLLQACVDSLNQGRNLMIFPEGTRTKNLKKLNFKRGAALIALGAKKNFTPVTVVCEPRVLAKGRKWYKIPNRKPHFSITVEPDLSIQSQLDSDESLSIRSRKLNRMLLNHYYEELSIGKNNP